MMPTPAKQMLALFNPGTHAHGVYCVNGAAEPGEKREGDATTDPGPITEQLMERHLRGEIRIGAVPIHRGSSLCGFGAIDVDDYRLDHAALVRKIERLKLPLILCLSKSRGAHLYAFFSMLIPAAQARELLANWAALLGHADIEVPQAGCAAGSRRLRQLDQPPLSQRRVPCPHRGWARTQFGGIPDAGPLGARCSLLQHGRQ